MRRAGRLVSSVILESACLDHPLVREAAVVGIPAGGGNDEIVAFVVLRHPGALDAVRAHLAEVLPAGDAPDRVKSLSVLPRTHNGKVLKRDLRLAVSGSGVGEAEAAARDVA